jgi:hypothetical protein
MLRRRSVLVGLSGACLTGALSASANAQTVRSEAANHPRIAKAIEGLEDAIRYLEAAPHDFGGHKVKAISDKPSSRQATSLGACVSRDGGQEEIVPSLHRACARGARGLLWGNLRA